MEQEATVLAHPHLQALDRDARQNVDRVRRLFSSLSEDQLTWKPDPKTWSIAECIEHLIITDGLYIPRVAEAIERGRREGASGDASYRPRLLAGWFINAAGENGKRKVKTMRMFNPDHAGRGGDAGAGERFVHQQEKLRDLIRRADGLDPNRTKFSSPVSGLVRLTLGEGLTLLIGHQKRHIAQAERMMGRVNAEL